MCTENAGWDDPLPDPLRAKWERCCRSLEELKSLDVNRFDQRILENQRLLKFTISLMLVVLAMGNVPIFT